MKSKSLSLLLIFATILGLTACQEKTKNQSKSRVGEHTCVFDQEIVDNKYLAQEANCACGAKYYKTCTCGKRNEETFVGSLPLDHTIEDGSLYCSVCHNLVIESTLANEVVLQAASEGISFSINSLEIKIFESILEVKDVVFYSCINEPELLGKATIDSYVVVDEAKKLRNTSNVLIAVDKDGAHIVNVSNNNTEVTGDIDDQESYIEVSEEFFTKLINSLKLTAEYKKIEEIANWASTNLFATVSEGAEAYDFESDALVTTLKGVVENLYKEFLDQFFTIEVVDGKYSLKINEDNLISILDDENFTLKDLVFGKAESIETKVLRDAKYETTKNAVVSVLTNLDVHALLKIINAEKVVKSLDELTEILTLDENETLSVDFTKALEVVSKVKTFLNDLIDSKEGTTVLSVIQNKFPEYADKVTSANISSFIDLAFESTLEELYDMVKDEESEETFDDVKAELIGIMTKVDAELITDRFGHFYSLNVDVKDENDIEIKFVIGCIDQTIKENAVKIVDNAEVDANSNKAKYQELYNKYLNELKYDVSYEYNENPNDCYADLYKDEELNVVIEDKDYVVIIRHEVSLEYIYEPVDMFEGEFKTSEGETAVASEVEITEKTYLYGVYELLDSNLIEVYDKKYDYTGTETSKSYKYVFFETAIKAEVAESEK